MSYKVVPFNLADDPVEALKRIIDAQAANGYRYVNHQYSDKLYPDKPGGCFGIGAKSGGTYHIGFVVFEKDD